MDKFSQFNFLFNIFNFKLSYIFTIIGVINNQSLFCFIQLFSSTNLPRSYINYINSSLWFHQEYSWNKIFFYQNSVHKLYKKNGIRLFNLKGILIAEFNFFDKISFSPNSKFLASISKISENELIIDNQENFQNFVSLKGHQKYIQDYKFSSDGSIIASIAYEINIYLWDVFQCKQLRILEGHKSTIKSIAFSFNGELLASYCEAHQLILWNYREGKQIKTLEEHTQEPLEEFTFSFDSQLLCFIKDYLILCVFNYTVDQNVIQLKGHRKQINKIAFTTDNLTLISQSSHWSDTFILLWDTQYFKLRNILYEEDTTFDTVLLSNDDSKLVVNQRDQYIRVYSL